MNFQAILLIFGCITSTLAAYSKKSCRQECSFPHDCPIGSECKLVGCNSLCKSSGLGLAQLGLNAGIGQVDPLLSVGSLHNDRLLANGGLIGSRSGVLGGGLDREVVLGGGHRGLIGNVADLASRKASLLSGRRGVLNSNLGLGLIGNRRGLVNNGIGQVFHGVDSLRPVIDPIDRKY